MNRGIMLLNTNSTKLLHYFSKIFSTAFVSLHSNNNNYIEPKQKQADKVKLVLLQNNGWQQLPEKRLQDCWSLLNAQ